MWRYIFGLFALAWCANAGPFFANNQLIVKDMGDPVGVPCTSNTSNAWLDIVVAIDVSTNMGPSQVRQIILNLASTLKHYPIGQSGNRYTRVSLITYASQVNVLANLTAITSYSQLSNLLLGITGSSSDSGADMADAVTQAYNQIYNVAPCDDPTMCEKMGRPTAFILFAATSSGNTATVIPTASTIQKFGTIITVNYNPSDSYLASILNQISSPSFNFSKSYTSKDMNWALTQTNCVCPWWEGRQLVVVEPSSGRTTRYAECFDVWELLMGPSNLNDTDICGGSDTGYPAALNAKATSDFVKNKIIFGEIPNKFYIGLHRQGLKSSGPWKWYTFFGNDMAMTNFTDWAPGANPNDPSTCALEYRLPNSTVDNETWGWLPASCELFDTGVTNVICSMKACTTDYICEVNFGYKERKEAKSWPRRFNKGYLKEKHFSGIQNH